MGNMEGGTSKRAELSLTPTKEGDYKADLIVTWEDALGEKYTEKRSISFSSVDFYPSGDLFSALLDIPDYPGGTKA